MEFERALQTISKARMSGLMRSKKPSAESSIRRADVDLCPRGMDIRHWYGSTFCSSREPDT
jgi:hypothetical protein